ncbi:MAG: metal-dependent hydrolase [Elusimicrobia bacterium]|nr:metal-dependent hydrolase [Elusimicrobiota bacterium]
MDNVTHTLCGFALGEAFFREKHGRRAVTISAWASNLPDVDVAVLLTRDPGAIVLRRSFGHSLLLLPFWIAGLSWIFKKRYSDMAYVDILKIVGVNAGAHVVFDLINSFGVQLLWPLSARRWEWSIVFIVDLFLAACLAAPHLVRLSKRWRPRLKEASRAGLAAAALYLLACAGLRARAMSLLRATEPGASFVYAFPEPFGPLRWHGVARYPGVWRQRLVEPLAGRALAEPDVPTDDGAPAVAAAAASPFGRRLLTFFKAPVWSAAPEPGGTRVSIRDLRFSSLTLRHEGFGFSFDVGPDGRAVPRGVRIW